MAKNRNRSRTVERAISAAVTFSFIFILAICTLIMLFTDKYVNIYRGLPEIENCVLDFSACDLENKYLKQHLSGEYEFFYNRWIAAENYQGESDAVVKVPHRWKGSTINGRTLDSTGYASYRLKVVGLKIGTPISFMNNNYIGAFYGYINRELVYQYGTRQKTGESQSSGSYTFSKNYVVDSDEPLEIVFEVSSSRQGGLSSAPRLVTRFVTIQPTSPNLTNNIGFFVLGITVALFVLSLFINVAGGKDWSKFSFVPVMLTITALTVFSIDVYWRLLSFLPFNSYNIIMDVNIFVNIALLGALFFHFVKSGAISTVKPWLIFLSSVGTISIVLYYVFMGTFVQIVAPILQIAGGLLLIYPLTIDFLGGKKFNLFYIFFLAVILVIMLTTCFDLINIIRNGLEQLISYLLILINLYVMILYWRIASNNSKNLIRALETEKEINAVKAEALKAQIKPHFIFNSLTNIQQAYEKDKRSGDRALTMFSRHMRANVDSDKIKTVSFSVELDNIMNYIELENMRRTEPIDVLLDCLDCEFDVPVLSLQPFIENAFKHARVDTVTDGYIEIITYETSSCYVAEINDNGVGFNPAEISPLSVGLRNATQRLQIVSSASVKIFSKPNCGTRIRIKFPKKTNL